MVDKDAFEEIEENPVTESEMPCEVGLIEQGCGEMIFTSHPAVLDLDHLISDPWGGGGESHGQSSRAEEWVIWYLITWLGEY